MLPVGKRLYHAVGIGLFSDPGIGHDAHYLSIPFVGPGWFGQIVWRSSFILASAGLGFAATQIGPKRLGQALSFLRFLVARCVSIIAGHWYRLYFGIAMRCAAR
jgi:hypothetical protein